MNAIALSNNRAIRQDARGRLEVQHHGGVWDVIGADSFEFFALGMFHRLLELSWVPVTDRRPTEEDADDCYDVEWSDGKTLWEAHFTDPREATHWRRIVLP